MPHFLPSYLPWISLSLFLFPLLLLLLNKSKKQQNLPPGPPKLPIIGNLHLIGKMPHHSITNLSKKYGPVMLLQLGRAPTLVVSSPEMAKEILKTNDLACCSRPVVQGPKRLSYNFLDIAFAPYSDYWREMRKIGTTELFSAKKLRSFVPVIEREAAQFIDAIAESAPSPVNLSERIFCLLDDIICTISCGRTYGGKQFDDGNIVDVINDAMAMLASFAAADFLPVGGWIVDVLTGLHRRQEKCFWNFDKFYQRMIDEHRDPARGSPENEDIIDVLLALMKNQTSGLPLTEDHIKAVLMNVFLGGVDTASITSVWAMAELVKNPRVMKKLQAELRRNIVGKQLVKDSDIVNLPYLTMVIKETFRMHPPSVFLIPRVTMDHVKIGGYNINPGTRIHVNVWGMGRDPKLWDNPEEFYPERFDGSDIDFKGRHFELLAFGSGRRMCPAMTIGASMLEVTVANLVRSFDWELPGGMTTEDFSMEEAFSLTVHKKVPLCLVPIKCHSGE